MVTTGLIVRLTAKAGKAEELAAFLRDALPLVQDEPDTVAWLAVAIGEASFGFSHRPPSLLKTNDQRFVMATRARVPK